MVSTILREIPAYAAQFSAYFVSKRLWAVHVEHVPVDHISFVGCFVSGGVGGFSCWLFSYPQDVIKTKL
jgi:hypothetical protein